MIGSFIDSPFPRMSFVFFKVTKHVSVLVTVCVVSGAADEPEEVELSVVKGAGEFVVPGT